MTVAVELDGTDAPPDAADRAHSTPMPPPRRVARVSRHRRLMHFNRLLVTVLAANAVVAVCGVRAGWWSATGTDLDAVALVAQVNLFVAVVPRQQWVVNLIGWVATRPSCESALRVRWALGKYYHVGGVHVGAGLAGVAWYLAFVVSLLVASVRGAESVSTANVVLAAWVLALLVTMVLMARPGRRALDHDTFEVTHRFAAWAVLALVWANTLLFVDHDRGDQPLWSALATSPTAWLLLLSTCFAMWPWVLLRKVPITVERPSSHCAIVRLDHGRTPSIGTTRPISRRPFVGWHHFACVPAAPGESGYRMLISRAGDWTSEFIDDPPSHVWVRGIPAVGVANVKRIFNRVVFVVTGSGIGPALGHLLAGETPSKLVWVTRDPRRTYGDSLIDEVMAANPDATIWNTDERGKPDVLRLAHGTCVDESAEAVICVSNRAVTWQVVEGLESRGIPAFGPIWDS